MSLFVHILSIRGCEPTACWSKVYWVDGRDELYIWVHRSPEICNLNFSPVTRRLGAEFEPHPSVNSKVSATGTASPNSLSRPTSSVG